MGVWGTGAFENDDAQDWLNELLESDDGRLLATSLWPEEDEGYLEAPGARRALAAAEIIAAMQGVPGRGVPKEARRWVAAHTVLDVSALVPDALAVIERILDEDSEVEQLWAEQPKEYDFWKNGMLDLQKRLGG